MREFLKGLDLDKETIDTIMAEYGKSVQGYKEQIEEYKTKIEELSSNVEDNSKLQQELDTLKKSIAEKEEAEKARTREEALNTNINEVIGDKKFINDYTKNAIVNEIKTALNDGANVGKSIKELFENITKDHDDIFANEQQFQDMAGMGDSEQPSGVKEIPQIW